MDLSGKVAIVTGGGRGIGEAIALRLAGAGAAVVVNDVGDMAPAGSVAARVKEMGGRSLVVAADVGRAEDVARLVETTLAEMGRVDILVNNAGITRDQLLMRLPEEDWDRVIQVNLKGVFLCTKAVLRPMMRQRWGRIISLSSIVGLVGNPGQASYAAAKAGIIGFTRTIAKEVASRGITVNAIAPGFIDTAMTQHLPEERRRAMAEQIPAGYLGKPEDVAAAVAFLASPEAHYITGHVLTVDGGISLGKLG